jgi:hypothetical protein
MFFFNSHFLHPNFQHISLIFVLVMFKFLHLASTSVIRIRAGFGKDPDLDPTSFFRSFQEAKKIKKTCLLLFVDYLP